MSVSPRYGTEVSVLQQTKQKAKLFCSDLLYEKTSSQQRVHLMNFELISPLNTKRRLLYLKTQFVPRSKHFSSRYKNQSVYAVSSTSRYLFSDKNKPHKYSVGRVYSCWMLNCWCITWPVGFKRLTDLNLTKLQITLSSCILNYHNQQSAIDRRPRRKLS